MPIKNSNDTIGNKTRDLPVCSAVPQPAAPLNQAADLLDTNDTTKPLKTKAGTETQVI
jgi:hypothetical protein